MNLRLVAMVTTIAVGVGVTTNAAAAFKHSEYHHGLGDGGFADRGLNSAGAGGYGSHGLIRGAYGNHYGGLSRWGTGSGLGVFGYDDRYGR